jgi:hypothetical protein
MYHTHHVAQIANIHGMRLTHRMRRIFALLQHKRHYLEWRSESDPSRALQSRLSTRPVTLAHVMQFQRASLVSYFVLRPVRASRCKQLVQITCATSLGTYTLRWPLGAILFLRNAPQRPRCRQPFLYKRALRPPQARGSLSRTPNRFRYGAVG